MGDNPTRRLKRFKRPRPLDNPLPDTRFDDDGGDRFSRHTPHRDHVRQRHWRATWKPDAVVRGTIFLSLFVATVVLYIILWEWERYPPFWLASVPNPNLNQDAMASSPSLSPPSSDRNPEAVDSTLYRSVVSQRRNGPFPSSTKELDPTVDWSVVRPSNKPGQLPTRNTWPPLMMRFPDDTHDTDHPLTPQTVGDRTPGDDDEHDIDASLSLFDSTYCDGACRFLIPVRIGEQESKARIHLTQLIALAQRLGRTVVLPNVGQSRMSVCAKWPFSAYYDTNGLFERWSEDSEDSSRLAIDLDRFAKWVDERPTPPRGIIVSVHHRAVRKDHPHVWGSQLESLEGVSFVMADTTDTVNSKTLSCLDSKLPRLRSTLPGQALSISIERKSSLNANVSTHLVQLLSSSGVYMDSESDFDWMAGPGYDHTPQYYTNASSLSLADLDVLVLDYDLRHPLFAASDSMRPDITLHYSPVLYDLADHLADNLGPFAAVHWRMESVPVQNLAWCAVSLVSVLHALLQTDDDGTGKHVKYAWLATDHPLPLSTFMDMDDMRIFPVDEESTFQRSGDKRRRRPGVAKSSTFKGLTSEHDDAIGILAEAFQAGGDLGTWTLTDLAEQLRLYPYVEGRFASTVDETLLEDSGVWGILDKLVVVQARVFVSGSAECSKISSFSKQVVEARQELFEAERGKGATRNVVEYFGQW